MKKNIALVEIFFLLGVIGILASLIFPAISTSREASKRTSCKSNLKLLTLANLMYADDNDMMMYPTSEDEVSTWTSHLSQSSYLNKNVSEVTGSPFECPNGPSLKYYDETNFSMNYRITFNSPDFIPHSVASTNNSETFMLIDGFNREKLVWRKDIQGNVGVRRILGSSERQRMARHEGKLNISFLNGSVRTFSGHQLLEIGNSLQINESFWTP